MDEPTREDLLHAVVYYPRLSRPDLNAFREEFDPFAHSIEEHLPVLFPVPLDAERVVRHTRSVVERIDAFDLHVAGLRKTWDHWLCVSTSEGRDHVVRLHDELYSGSMSGFRRLDLPYEPHIAIGFFGMGPYDPLDPRPIDLDAETYRRARERAEALEVDAWRRVDRVTIVELDRGAGTLRNVEEVALAGAGD